MADHQVDQIPDLYLGRDDDPWRYELWTQIGGGSEGRVWRGTRVQNDGSRLDVALKVMRPDRFNGAEPLEQVAEKWEDQAAQLRNLNVPGIVGVQEAFLAGPPHPPGQEVPTEPRTLYFVMSWVNGKDLSSWAEDHPRFAERLGVLETAADGLDKLHESGHVHADIKPSNVRIRNTGPVPASAIPEAVLVDFGLMRTITGEAPSRIGGSPGYLAPELHQVGGTYSAETDLYGFAGLIAFLLTNESPPLSGNVPDTVRSRLEANDLPSATVDILVASLDPDPSRRPHKSATSLLSAIRGELSSSVLVAADDPALAVAGARHVRANVRPVRESRAPVGWIAALVVLAFLAGVLLLRGRGDDEPRADAAGDVTAARSGASTSGPSSTTLGNTTSGTAATSTTVKAAAPSTTVPATTATKPIVTTGTTLPPTVYLSDMDYVEQGGVNYPQAGLVKVDGVNYVHGITFKNMFCRDTVYFDYDLSKNYTSFTTLAGIPDSGRSDSPNILAIYLDGRKEWEQSLSVGSPQQITLPVTGVLRVRFEITRENTRYCTAVALGDPVLTK